MIARISKSFTFSSAHRLPHVGAKHKCSRIHGHNYRVDLVFEGHCHVAADPKHKPNEDGMVVDFDRVAVIFDPIHRLLDHRLLNEVPGLENPTAEVIAAFIARAMMEIDDLLPLVTVRVHEDDTSWAEVDYSRKRRPDWAIEE